MTRLPWWLRQESIHLQCGRPGFDPWVGKILWRQKWQPTPVLLPGKSHGWGIVVSYSPQGWRVRHDWATSLSIAWWSNQVYNQLYILLQDIKMVCALIKFISTLATLASFINGASDTGKYFELSEEISLVKTMVFPVVIYGGQSWTIKKTDPWRTDAFELWCWRRLLGVPWTARRSNQSILKEISPEYSLEGLMLKLKLQ